MVRCTRLREASSAIDGNPITLYRHQAQAIAKATRRQSFAVTTGTGSGKSLCFFVPIIDAAIRARVAGDAARTRAIVIYPMNALANSQMKELEKFIDQSELSNQLRPTFARYTGQESADERERIRQAKPDILLTNFMMLELLMTRQNALDRAVIDNAHGLDFIVLDELHTYRGRQGADVAMLVRRVRDRLCRDHEPICIGTSATMASEGSDAVRAAAVANVASRLFGTTIPPDGVIDEIARTSYRPFPHVGEARPTPASRQSMPTFRIRSTTMPCASHPLAIWIELEIGLEDRQRLSRRTPTTIKEAAERLAKQTGRDEARCRSQLQAMLILMSRPANERGGNGDRAFMAFKLHRFLSGAGRVYATLRAPPNGGLPSTASVFDPDDPDARLYATFFCRNCGQEHHPVVLVEEGGVRRRPAARHRRNAAGRSRHRRESWLPDAGAGQRCRFRSLVTRRLPEDWLEVGRERRARDFAPRSASLCRARAHRRRNRNGWDYRTSSLVPARQVSFVPGVRRSAGRHKRARSTNWRAFQPKAVARLRRCSYRAPSVG